MPALGASLILMTVGALLTAGLSASGDDAVVSAVGAVLMVVAGAGILASLLFFLGFSPFRRQARTDNVRQV